MVSVLDMSAVRTCSQWSVSGISIASGDVRKAAQVLKVGRIMLMKAKVGNKVSIFKIRSIMKNRTLIRLGLS